MSWMSNSNSKIKVIVGMSGGVDSSVTALLLLQQGYTVEGLFMKNWEEDDTENFCNAKIDVKDAQNVCNKLGIKLHTVNFSAEYWDEVFTNFLEEHKAGRTPNPDILCNKKIKFKACLDYAKILGANYFATGHYAKKITLKDYSSSTYNINTFFANSNFANSNLDNSNFANSKNHDFYLLTKPKDENKDQTYFLYTLTQSQLKQVMFPLSDLNKSEIRELAKQHEFLNYNKKDSTGICFIGERNFKNFLQKYLPPKPGNIINMDNGQKLGTHDGLMYYTLGQRQGLGIGGQSGSNNAPWYVVEKDLKTNELKVAQSATHPKLFAQKFTAKNIHWITQTPNVEEFNCLAKVRYRQKEQTCKVKIYNTKDNFIEVIFDQKQKAITPGQSVVFYTDDKICLGGGIIDEVIKSC